MDPADNNVQVRGLVLYRETARALLVGPPAAKDGEKEWLPKSQIRMWELPDEGDIDDLGEEPGYIEIPRWLAEDRHLEFEEV